MTSYTFDEESATFYYFVLTMVGAYAVPATWRMASRALARAAKTGGTEPATSETVSVRKRAAIATQARASAASPVRGAILALLWVVLAWALRGALRARTTAPRLWDPFEVLGVSPSADEEGIKQAFKRLSRQFHPDKVAEEERAGAEGRFVEISKAYRALTDEDTRRNWEEYGNPDGVRTFALGVALPSWLVASPGMAVALVLLYFVAFGLALPLGLRAWWARNRVYTSAGVRQTTMHMLYAELREGASPRRILELIAQASEHEEIPVRPTDKAALENLLGDLRDATGEPAGGMPRRLVDGGSFAARRAFALLWAHVQRVDVADAGLRADQGTVVARAHKIATLGVLTIALSRDFYATALASMTTAQCLVSATWEGDSALLQLPHVTRAMVASSAALRRVANIGALLDMAPDARRALFPGLSDAQYAELVSVAETFPEARLERASFRVLGQDAITPGGVITCQARIAVEYPHASSAADEATADGDDGDAADDDEPEAFEFDEDGNLASDTNSRATKLALAAAQPPPVYCPRYPETKRPCWWVALVNRGNTGFVVEPVRVYDLVDRKTVTLTFPAPSRAVAQVAMQLVVRSDWGVDAGFTKEVRFAVVEPADAAGSASESDDPWGISGDEDDAAVSFAD